MAEHPAAENDIVLKKKSSDVNGQAGTSASSPRPELVADNLQFTKTTTKRRKLLSSNSDVLLIEKVPPKKK